MAAHAGDLGVLCRKEGKEWRAGVQGGTCAYRAAAQHDGVLAAATSAEGALRSLQASGRRESTAVGCMRGQHSVMVCPGRLPASWRSLQAGGCWGGSWLLAVSEAAQPARKQPQHRTETCASPTNELDWVGGPLSSAQQLFSYYRQPAKPCAVLIHPPMHWIGWPVCSRAAAKFDFTQRLNHSHMPDAISLASSTHQ